VARRDNRPRLMTIELEGPFFTADPVKTYRANVRDLMDDLAKAAEAEVKSRLRPGPAANAVRGYIHGRTYSYKTGKRWASYMVVSSTDRSLDGATQRRVNAQLSGRRLAVTGRQFVYGGAWAKRPGTPIGTMRGADGRKAFAGAARGFRAVINGANLTKGI